MSISKEHQAYIMDCFADYDEVMSKRMFGGLGIFKEGLMFALLLSDGEFRLKANHETAKDFIAEGCIEWEYQRGSKDGKPGKTVKMGFWSVPDGLLDEPHTLYEWSDKAFEVAKQADAQKPKSKQKWSGAL